MRQFSNSLNPQKTYASFVLKVYYSSGDILSLLLVSFSITSCYKVHYDQRNTTSYFCKGSGVAIPAIGVAHFKEIDLILLLLFSNFVIHEAIVSIE